jgi:penicillin-binding protein 1A
LGSIISVMLSVYLVKVTAEDEQTLNLTNLKLSFTSTIYYQDDEGKWLEYQRLDGNENRIWVDLRDIPENVKNAYIAVEDKNFYNHHGVNVIRTFAAMINEYTPIKLFRAKTGASTITQQLVKNLTSDKSGSGFSGAMRKVREIFRAYVLEKQYSKDQILEAYLNTLRLSNNWAGVQAGANNYFGKDVSRLTLAEAASLAGITKNPSQYNPYTHPEENVKRRNDVLYFMFQQKLINEEDYNRAIDEELVLNQEIKQRSSVNSYFTDMLIDQVVKDLMAQYNMTKSEATNYLYNGGLRIYSTVKPKVQSAMEDVMGKDHELYPDTVAKIKKDDGTIEEETPQAAMITLDYDGGIVGVVGGLGEKTQDRVLNRAVDSVRQTGSTMKPIGAYALGIEYHYINFSTALYDDYVKEVPDEDHPGRMKPWPRNYSHSYSMMAIPVVQGLRKSLNTIAVRTIVMVGADVSYDFVKNTLHITSLVPGDADDAPMALGAMTYGISPLEMAAAYAIFGSGGKYVTPHCYTTVEDTSGDIILEKKVTTVQAISEETAYIMNRMLKQVLFNGEGTAHGLYPERLDSVGKTGTTSDDKDHWFMGLTPYYVTASWWGYDDPVPLAVSYGKHPPTRAWRYVMNKAQEGLPFKEFPKSKNVVTAEFCKSSGLLANGNCPDREVGYYTTDNMPMVCGEH